MTLVPPAPRLPDQRVRPPDHNPHLTITMHVTLPAATIDPAAAVRELVGRLTDVGITVAPACLVEPRSTAGDGPETVLIDPRARTVTRGGTPVPLCRREYDLLLFLAEHPGQVFTRGQLLDAVWNQPFTGPRTVDVHVRRLRHKLGTRPPLIATVRGVGYRLATCAPVAVTGGPNVAPPSPAIRPHPDHVHRGAA